MSFPESIRKNRKGVCYLLKIAPPLLEGAFGFIQAVKDGYRRRCGEKTSIVEAVEAYVAKLHDEHLAEVRNLVKNQSQDLRSTWWACKEVKQGDLLESAKMFEEYLKKKEEAKQLEF